MTKEQKLQFIDILSSIFYSERKNIYLANISNMNAHQTNELRKHCYTSQVKVMMIKNTLLSKVIEKYKKKWSPFFQVVKGNTFIMISSIDNAPAKIIKNNKMPLLKAAYVDESFYIGNDKLEYLVNLKSKEELIIGIILSLQSSLIIGVIALKTPIYNIIKYLQKKY